MCLIAVQYEEGKGRHRKHVTASREPEPELELEAASDSAIQHDCDQKGQHRDLAY